MRKNIHSMLMFILISFIAWSSCHALAVTPLPATTAAATLTFDFNSGLPTLPAGRPTPFSQTLGNVTANFSSPFDPAAFSVQSYETTFFQLSQFSGMYLYDNSLPTRSFDIRFNAQLTSITFSFATIEYHGGPNVEPSNVTLTAYMDTVGTTPVGSATARGTWPSGDSFPQGKLSFDSGGQPFNLVRIELPYQGSESAADFLVDNIMVTVRAQGAAAFTSSGLTIDPSSVDVGGAVTVSVECSNEGSLSGSHTITLKIDEEVEDEKTVTLDPDETTTVSFEVSAMEEGSYSVDVNGLTGSYEVKKAQTGISGFPIGSIIAGLTIVLLAQWLYHRRS